MMILINGGSSSGKSAFAETLIEEQEKKEAVSYTHLTLPTNREV